MMLRSLGITSLIKWFVVACVALAVWQAYNGNIGAIADAVWGWIQAGADVVSRIWDSVNSGAGNDLGNAGGNGGGHGNAGGHQGGGIGGGNGGGRGHK